jgi:hypothetical protein
MHADRGSRHRHSNVVAQHHGQSPSMQPANGRSRSASRCRACTARSRCGLPTRRPRRSSRSPRRAGVEADGDLEFGCGVVCGVDPAPARSEVVCNELVGFCDVLADIIPERWIAMNPPAGWHLDPYDPAFDRYWDGYQWTGHIRPRGGEVPTQVFAASGTGYPGSSSGTRRRTWPWLLGVVALGAGFVIVVAAAGQDQQPDLAPVVATVTSSAVPVTTTTTTATTTPPAPATTTSPAPVPMEPEVAASTTEEYLPTTQAATPEPVPTRSLEYSCSDAVWREAMGSEGDALCGSTSRPRNPTQPTIEYTAPPVTTREQSSLGTVHPGSYCSTPGAAGVTTQGTAMVCAPGSDGEDRWRSAN